MKPTDRSTFVRNTAHLQQYRECVAGLDIPDHDIDELISIVYSILSYFVDTAFDAQTDQITLRSVGGAFNVTPGRATIEQHPENQTANVQDNGVEEDSNRLGPTEP